MNEIGFTGLYQITFNGCIVQLPRILASQNILK